MTADTHDQPTVGGVRLMTDRVVRTAVQSRIEGRAIVTGGPLRRWSVCLLCGLDSGPWMCRRSAEVSGLLHLTRHHANVVPDDDLTTGLRHGWESA